MNRTQPRAAGLALIVFAIVLGIIGWPLSQRPARYDTTATVKVERDKVDLPELNKLPELAALATAEVDSTYFIQTEIALLQSEATLNKVITNLDLNHVWGRRLYGGQVLKTSETLQILKTRLQVQPGPDAALITIKATSEIPTEAAEVANTTAKAYCDYRAEYRRRLTQSALDAKAGKFAEMQKNLAAAREKLQQAGQQLDPALREQAATETPTGESETLRTLRARYSESMLRYLAKSNQLALYQPKDADTDENVAQLRASAEKAKAGMVAAETAARTELGKRELLENYRTARLELDELNQLFAPLKKTVEGLQNDLRPQGNPPAQIEEQALAPTTPDTREAARGRLILGSGGVAFVVGLGLLWFSRKPKTSPK